MNAVIAQYEDKVIDVWTFASLSEAVDFYDTTVLHASRRPGRDHKFYGNRFAVTSDLDPSSCGSVRDTVKFIVKHPEVIFDQFTL
jgi:hypothetical protein